MKTCELFVISRSGKPKIVGTKMTPSELIERFLYGQDLPFIATTPEHDAVAAVLRLAAELVEMQALQEAQGHG